MQCFKFVSRYNFINGGFQRLLLFSTSSSSSTSSSNSNPAHCFADYMIDTLGFSQNEALPVSTRLFKRKKVNNCHFVENANSVVNLFKKHGFDETHLRKAVSKSPQLLSCKTESTLLPKFQFLKEQGFSESDIIRVISANPSFLHDSLDSSIVPTFQILTQFMGRVDHVIRVLVKLGKARRICNVVKNLLPNVALLESYGISIEIIRKHVLRQPDSYMRNPTLFKDVTMRIEEKLQITRDSGGFLYGIDLMFGLSEERLLSKCRIFKSFGWTQSEIDTLLMKSVNIFTSSEERIKKCLDFLMNEVQLKPAYLVAQGRLTSYSLEKRLVPKHKIMLILKEKGLCNQHFSFCTAIKMTEPVFLKRFVLPFKEVHEVYANHTGCSLEMLSQGSANIRS